MNSSRLAQETAVVSETAAIAKAPPTPTAAPLTLPDGRRVRVVHLVAELAPFARSGGLGEAVASLARFQVASGVPAAIMMPLYAAARENAPAIEPVGAPFRVQVGRRIEPARLWRLSKRPDDPRVGTEVYFIESAEYFDRPYLYGPPGSDFPDNARRYAFFCMAALAAIPRIAGQDPVILHAHDWHTALAPVYLRTLFAGDVRYGWVSVVLTVHNAGYQGHFPPETITDVGLPRTLYNWRQLEWYGRMNMLKGGLVFADAVTTVSPTHAHELRTPTGGFGLDGVFRGLRDRFIGITNGIDQRRWDPATDPAIPAHYSADSLEAKERCREALQQEIGLRSMKGVPIFAMTARLVAQKGLDLILGDPGYFALDAQFLFLGAGEPRYETALSAIAARAPHRISVQLGFTEELEHKLLAGADMCLMPSQYEPCGLTQMRAQRYGTLPIARRIGGLADTIEDNITGFLFDDYDAADFMRAAVRAVDQYNEAEGWRRMMKEAMARDFGWEQSAAKYLNLYRRVVQITASR
jgi:starch synthase